MYDAVEGEPTQVATEIRRELAAFLQPLLIQLDTQMDRRLVATFARTIQAILCFRNRPHGLLLSELGAYLLSPEHAAAGTKRLSNLLRSSKWSASASEEFLWTGATTHLEELEDQGNEALVLWDESVLEKPESSANPDLGPVRSSKAYRLTRIKPGFYNPPGRPIFVPGFQWIGLVLAGMTGTPRVAALQWWTTRGERTSDKRTEERVLLQRCLDSWGRRVCHVFDRGFAGRPWLALLGETQVRFVLRWPARNKLADVAGTLRPAWQLVRGKHAWDHRLLWDARHHCARKTGILAVPVLYQGQSFVLVVARRGAGQQPWYLLTNEPVAEIEELWQIVLRYARRWQLEMVWRYGKSELGMESVRVWTWERRKKLLLLAALAYAFLVSLLDPDYDLIRTWLLEHWCHRTGKRSRETPTPLYRLRSALSRLWLAYPSRSPVLGNSG
jgi:DDE family transposase